jgi:hypothetical protein
VDITKDEAAEAIRKAAFRVTNLESQDYGRVLIHTFAGPFGADWDLDEAILTVSKAKRCAWLDSITSHDLGIETEDGKVVLFNCQRPECG